MYSVVITQKGTGAVVAQVPVTIRGMNYDPSPAEYHSLAWETAIDDKLIQPDADKTDYAFRLVPVSAHDVFSPNRGS